MDLGLIAQPAYLHRRLPKTNRRKIETSTFFALYFLYFRGVCRGIKMKNK